MGNFLNRKPVSAEPSVNKYEPLGFSRNPFPVDPAVKPNSNDDRENGSIFYTDLRNQEISQFKNIVIGQNDKINLLMDYAAYSGRGIGKTAFLNYIKRQINEDFGDSYSNSQQVLYSIYVSPGGEKRERKFWQIAKLIYESIRQEDLLLVTFCRIRALSGIIPEDVLDKVDRYKLAETLANDNWLQEMGVDLYRLNKEVDNVTNAIIDERPFGFSQMQLDISYVLHSYHYFEKAFTPDQSDLYWKKNGVNFVFNTLVKLLKMAEFSHCYILFDEAEKIIISQNPTERREFCDNLRHYFIDGPNENATFSFFKILMTIHPNSQELLLPHWQSAGLERFTELGGTGADHYTIFFHPLKDYEMAVALAGEYIKHAHLTNSSNSGIRPFTSSAIAQALRRAENIPGKFLKLLHNAVEKAITDNWGTIDVRHIDNIWNSLLPSTTESKDELTTLPEPKTKLFG